MGKMALSNYTDPVKRTIESAARAFYVQLQAIRMKSRIMKLYSRVTVLYDEHCDRHNEGGGYCKFGLSYFVIFVITI